MILSAAMRIIGEECGAIIEALWERLSWGLGRCNSVQKAPGDHESRRFLRLTSKCPARCSPLGSPGGCRHRGYSIMPTALTACSAVVSGNGLYRHGTGRTIISFFATDMSRQ